jgi:integrase
MRAADPALDLSWLAAIRRALDRLARRTGPARSKHGRIVATGTLIDAGVKLLTDAYRDQTRRPHERAKDFRDGLMVALLAARPLRIKNFAGLRLGRHLHPTASGYAIEIPGEETKTGCPIETFVPDDLCPWLSIYLSEYRTHLLRGGVCDYVWVHGAGVGYTPGSLSMRIVKLTARNVGVAISPHLFRDCAATTIATDDPEHVLTIAPILGHTNLRTAELHYNHAQCLEASRQVQRAIIKLRSQSTRQACSPLQVDHAHRLARRPGLP